MTDCVVQKKLLNLSGPHLSYMKTTIAITITNQDPILREELTENEQDPRKAGGGRVCLTSLLK